jgi:Ca-activated chloride channel family protein
VDAITKVRGANYYSVHSSKEFMVRMDDEFDFMVTPLVFDLELKLDAEGYDIEKVYGSPEADEATGEIMHVNTLFPSKSVEGETKGGLVLLKLKKTSQDASLTLSVSYEDRNGVEDSDIAEIEFGDEGEDYYENTGIRKGILLARYADLMKNWIIDEREAYEDDDWDGDDDGWPRRIQPSITYEIGIICPPPFPPFYELNEWERQSMDLVVSDHYKDLFDKFIDYFAEEMDEIGDESLEKELEILYELI